MPAISIIVFTRNDLAANNRPAAHMAAGVPIGMAINKTADCNGRSYVLLCKPFHEEDDDDEHGDDDQRKQRK